MTHEQKELQKGALNSVVPEPRPHERAGLAAVAGDAGVAGGHALHLCEEADPLVLLREVDAHVAVAIGAASATAAAAADLGDDADGGVADRAPLVLGRRHARLHPHAVADLDLNERNKAILWREMQAGACSRSSLLRMRNSPLAISKISYFRRSR